MPRPHYLAPPRDRRASRASANLPAWLPRPVPRAAPPSPPSAAPVPAEPGDGAWVAWGLTARRGRTGRAGRHAGRGCGDGWVRAGDTKDLSARPEVPRPGARAESCVGKSAAPGGGGPTRGGGSRCSYPQQRCTPSTVRGSALWPPREPRLLAAALGCLRGAPPRVFLVAFLA
jgi:hypothetical protein